jgi:hypothetical protein
VSPGYLVVALTSFCLRDPASGTMHRMDTTRRLDTLAIRRLSLAAEVDPRTLQRELRSPGSVRGMTGDRIRRVFLEAFGVDAYDVHAHHDHPLQHAR